MKNIIITLIAVFAFSLAQGQEKSDSKISESKLDVKGVCGMCKDRIEEAAMRTKGVKTADWNKESQELTVVYRNDKTSLEEISQSVADVGHDTETVPADSTAYSSLHNCCRYREGAKCSEKK